MGSGSRPKASAQPRTVLQSGVTDMKVAEGIGGAAPGTAGEEELQVNLINLNPGLIRITKKGESVQVVQTGTSPLQVLTSGGRLGDIPEHSEAKIKQGGLFRGVVVALTTDPDMARIALRN